MVRDALAGRFVTGELTLDGQRFIGTPVNIPPLGWIVLVAQPRHAALQPLLSTWGALAVGALAALLLAVFVGWVLARRLARRIGRYADQAHAIAGGDYDQPWPITWIWEFDNLAGDLERMSVAIRQRERNLATSEARYRMLSDCNQALIRITDEIELLTTICAIAVREGGYRMAWVGYAESDQFKTVRPMAHAGFEEGYLRSTNIPWADDDLPRAAPDH
ncbi:MAG: hypothetical protein U1F70_10900 [Candidatus Competibacteraceae bacterium]